ncbi:hypothetical protein Sala_1788 [Sphingopyxis alaskensis RB2256]|uniref:Uncharacterized protein n=1 Tax=Sphingopyxis alaskensis (strain DSM 13593 / LMG 18877 / RB2256) TaxID=317655 RepID=Q1GS72_SPHAL|nr:hypothetical protein Sala_1788 [Sphingopyxis alaskensis RB2256]
MELIAFQTRRLVPVFSVSGISMMVPSDQNGYTKNVRSDDRFAAAAIDPLQSVFGVSGHAGCQYGQTRSFGIPLRNVELSPTTR